MILIFALLWIKSFQQDNMQYKKKCFRMPGNPGNTIPIMVNSNKLIPDTLGLAINIQEITKTDKTVNHESKIYLREVVGTCEGSILIPNFMTEETEHIGIDIKAFWESDFVIEVFEVFLYPQFPYNEFVVEGNTNKLCIILAFSQNVKTFKQYMSIDLLWTKKIKSLQCDQALCLRIFDLMGDYSLKLDEKMSLSGLLGRYNYFEISSYEDIEMENVIFRKKYLAEIHQCSKNTKLPQLKITVDDSIKAFEIKIISKLDKKVLKMKYALRSGFFVQNPSAEHSYNLLNILVNVQDFDEAWKNRFDHLLLHYQVEDWNFCSSSIPGNYVNFVHNGKGKIYIKNSYFLYNHQSLKLKKYIRGTPKEEEECFDI